MTHSPLIPCLAVYVHLPWCVRKCPYCDFNSHPKEGEVPEQRYVDAVLRDLQTQAAHAAERTVTSVFFGGGTPSLFSAHAIGRILEGIRGTLRLASGAEITLEANPGTVFFHRPPPLPDDEATWEMQLACQDMLAAGGFRQYEVSAYARDGRRCAHNLNYWQFGDYLGIGAGAHGKITAAGEVLRTVRVRQPRQYLESLERAPAPPQTQAVARADLPFEYMLNALRLVDGFSVQGFEDRTGLDFDAVEPRILQAVTQGMLEERPRRTWRATPLGWRFLNDVIAAFLPQPAPPFSRPVQAANPH